MALQHSDLNHGFRLVMEPRKQNLDVKGPQTSKMVNIEVTDVSKMKPQCFRYRGCITSTAVLMKMSVSAEEPTLHWKRKTTITYHTHILTSFLKLKVAAYLKNTAFLDFAKRKTYFYNFQ